MIQASRWVCLVWSSSGICQLGRSIWIYVAGDIWKVKACKVKFYELHNRDKDKNADGGIHVMVEDGL